MECKNRIEVYTVPACIIGALHKVKAILLFGAKMKILIFIIMSLSLIPTFLSAKDRTPAQIIATEPVTMMDLGILKFNTSMARPNYPGLQGATISAKYNANRGTIDIKVSMPVKMASKDECKTLIENAKKIFVKTYDDKKVSNIHYFFEHEGTGYKNKVDWKDLPKYVVLTGVVLTGKNYQDSVYCQSNLMDNKITF